MKKAIVCFRDYVAADMSACMAIFKSNIPRYFVERELIDFEGWLIMQSTLVRRDREAQQYLVMLVADKIVGCGGYHIDLNKKYARMTWGMVDKTYHRSGLGTQLLLHRISLIRGNCPDCRIEMDTTQHAAPFFEKMGFQTIKITPDFYAPGMDRYDMMLTN